MQIGIPELQLRLTLEPFDTHEEAENNAGTVLLTASFMSGPDDFGRDDAAVGLRYERFLELAGDALFDEVA